MSSPKPSREEPRQSRVPKVFMLVIVVVMALLALYANAQRWRRSQFETVIITPAGSPSALKP